MEVTTCLIAGGGPAGMMLGLLLARADVAVTVVEKHSDFLRDFRGDTVHASTIRLLDELGLGDRFRELPQSRLRNFEIPGPDGTSVVVGDFGTLKPPYDHIAMVPQWDLLSLLAEAGRAEPTFTLRMDTALTDLLFDGDRVVGARVRTADGRNSDISATLVVGGDGRSSTVRASAGLVPKRYRVPFDTWWFRLPRYEHDRQPPDSLEPRFARDEILLSIPRRGYFQLAYFAAKGAGDRIAREGIEGFRQRIATLRPDLADRVAELASLADLHHLDVKLDRLHRWHREGLLCIGDAAHAMSPAGGVGINLAIQDAVAAAKLLAAPLRSGRITGRDLAKVRRRRWWPTVVIQTMQRVLHRAIFDPMVHGRTTRAASIMPRVMSRIPLLTAIPARLVAVGPQPERAPDWARRPAAAPPAQ
jgi:2-polyprenyl-6-methoxyphenol hydroxylase-like FAD-dependent oxidoreductase